MRLSVIVPSYNEAERLPKTLQEISSYLRKQSYDYEILVVNGGSTDTTAQAVENMISQIPGLKILTTENRGKGFAVMKGMLATQGDFRVFTDADNSTSIDQVEKMWPEFEKGNTVVIGSRDIPGAVLVSVQPRWRRMLGDIFNLIVQIISGMWGIWDTQCGFKGFTKIAAEAIFSRISIEKWAFDVEVLVLAKKMGFQIKEIPVTWVNDPRSKVNLKGMIQMLFEVLQIRKNELFGKYGKVDYAKR